MAAATANWQRLADTAPVVIETLEGLRAIIRSGVVNNKLVKVVGTFDVRIPIEISSVGTLYDFSTCHLRAHALPVLNIVGFMNCFNELSVDLELPEGAQAGPVETLENGQEPSGNFVISGIVDSGSAFLDLSLYAPPCPVEHD